MQICLIIHSLGIGGMERVMSLLANNFADQKQAEIHVLLIGRFRVVEYELSEKVTIHKPGFEFNGSRRSWHTIRTMAFIRKTIKNLKPDTILSFGEIWNNLVLLSLLGTGYPVYVSDRCKPDKSLGTVHDFLRKKLYKYSAGIVAQTEYAKEFFYKLTRHKNIQVIGNPIRFIDASKNNRNKEILTVGRLISTKHHDRLIQMFLEVKQPGWKLVIVGGDAQKQKNRVKLEQLVEDHEAQKYVKIMGEKKNVDPFYQRASIFAFTSSSEGFPNVVGEALSAGLPVVAYDCISGPSDLISHGKNGYLLDLFDDESFKEYLLKLMNDRELREEMGEQAVEPIQQYSPENIGQKFYRFITSHL